MPQRSRPAQPGGRSGDARDRLALRADCAGCFGLCCVALPFSASADFAIDKDAGQPCPNLGPDFRCGIHHRLRQDGFPGCAAYDCFGAGQKVSQVTFGGPDWRRRAPESAGRMFEVFPVMRRLHEMLWYLAEALTLRQVRPAGPLRAAILRALAETESLTHGGPEALLELDITAHRGEVRTLLLRVSELVRSAAPGPRPKIDRSGADLIGTDLRGADLRGADLRGAYLIGANLRGAELSSADLLGADLRGADLGGADLAESIFLPQSALEAARGDHRTTLPPALTRPAHWTPADARPTRAPAPDSARARAAARTPARRPAGPRRRETRGK